MNTLAIDLSQLTPDILNKINAGEYVISQSGGLVRDLNGKIIKHIPLKEISCENIANTQQLITSFQNSLALSTALSTGIILGAIIVSTKLILNKLNKIEELAEQILQEIYDQNRFQYFLQLKEYIATAVSLKELSPVLNENKDLVLMKLNQLSIKRQEILIVSIERMMQLNKLSTTHKEIVLNFLHQTITLLPKLFYLEKDVAIALNRLKYAKILENNFIYEYNKLNNKYKSILNIEYQNFIKGNKTTNNLLEILNEYKEEDKLNSLLLKHNLKKVLIER